MRSAVAANSWRSRPSPASSTARPTIGVGDREVQIEGFEEPVVVRRGGFQEFLRIHATASLGCRYGRQHRDKQASSRELLDESSDPRTRGRGMPAKTGQFRCRWALRGSWPMRDAQNVNLCLGIALQTGSGAIVPQGSVAPLFEPRQKAWGRGSPLAEVFGPFDYRGEWRKGVKANVLIQCD